MGLMASENSGSTEDYELPAESAFAARCIAAIGLGTHPNTHPDAKAGAMKAELMLIWELSDLMEDGKPFTINWRGTLSLGKNANLTTRILQPWRNKDFTDEEKAGFDLMKVVGVPGLLTVKHKGKYANVGSLIPLPEAMAATLIDQVNPTVKFSVDQLGTNADFDNIWPWVQKIIEASEEGKAYKALHPDFFNREEKQDENAGTDVGKDTGGGVEPAF
jgi:hypothetical protein